MVSFKQILAVAVLGVGLSGAVQAQNVLPSLEEITTNHAEQQIKSAEKSYFKIIINPALPTLSYYHTVGTNTELLLDNVLVGYGRPSTTTFFGTNRRILSKRTDFYIAKMGSPLEPKEWSKCYALNLDFYCRVYGRDKPAEGVVCCPFYIHFTDLTNSLGKANTLGCIRVRWSDIEKIFPLVVTESNSRVDIIYNLARIRDGKLYLSGDLYNKGIDVGSETEKALAGFPYGISDSTMSEIGKSIIHLRANKSATRIINLESPTNANSQ